MIRVRPGSVSLTAKKFPVRMAEPKPLMSEGVLVLTCTDIRIDARAVLEDGPPAKGAGSGQPSFGPPVPNSARQGNLPTPALPPSGSALLAPKGWRLGWIQLELSEINWAYYEGLAPGDGSVLMRFDTLPARKVAICRDTDAEGQLWY